MLDSPLLSLRLDSRHHSPLFEQIYQQLRAMIVDGSLPAHTRLPPSRKLAAEVGVSRSTVTTAYEQLLAEGFITSRIGAGMFVSDIGITELPVRTDSHVVHPASNRNSQTNVAKSTLGSPDPELFPYRQWGKCVARVARTAPHTLIQATEVLGDLQLRQEIAHYLEHWRGIRVGAEQVIITAGADDALERCINVLTQSCDAIGLEDPGYQPLRSWLSARQQNICYLPVDASGAVPPSVHSPEKLLILTPSSQFPLGGAMPQARRSAFISWAKQADGWIIEDDYDSEFRYAGRPIQAMMGMDDQQRTLYVGSFSKVFSNSLRLGYIVIPLALLDRFQESFQYFRSKASLLPQHPLAEFMKNGDFYRHIRRVRRIYAERRTWFISAVTAAMEKQILIEDHRAGMHVTLQFAEPIDDQLLAARLQQQGIICSALSSYYRSAEPLKGLVMSFCHYQQENMERVAKLLRQELLVPMIASFSTNNIS